MSRVLILEDDSNYSSLLSYFLKEAGHEVLVTERTDAAMNAVEETPFDAVLVDQWLPESGEDGIHFIADLRRRGHRMGVVLLTALIPYDAEERVNGLDVWKVMDKVNVESDQLLRVVDEASEFTRLRDENGSPSAGASR